MTEDERKSYALRHYAPYNTELLDVIHHYLSLPLNPKAVDAMAAVAVEEVNMLLRNTVIQPSDKADWTGFLREISEALTELGRVLTDAAITAKGDAALSAMEDLYKAIQAQAVPDTPARRAYEAGHGGLETVFWHYIPQFDIELKEMAASRMKPSCPDQDDKRCGEFENGKPEPIRSYRTIKNEMVKCIPFSDPEYRNLREI